MLKRALWVILVFSLVLPLLYAHGEEKKKIKYVDFDLKAFCEVYSKNDLEMTDAQFEEWFNEQKQKYVKENTHIVAEGYIFEVKKVGDDYEASISHAKGFLGPSVPHLYLKKLSKAVGMGFKKHSKIKFSGKPTDFSSSGFGLNIELMEVKIK